MPNPSKVKKRKRSQKTDSDDSDEYVPRARQRDNSRVSDSQNSDDDNQQAKMKSNQKKRGKKEAESESESESDLELGAEAANYRHNCQVQNAHPQNLPREEHSDSDPDGDYENDDRPGDFDGFGDEDGAGDTRLELCDSSETYDDDDASMEVRLGSRNGIVIDDTLVSGEEVLFSDEEDGADDNRQGQNLHPQAPQTPQADERHSEEPHGVNGDDNEESVHASLPQGEAPNPPNHQEVLRELGGDDEVPRRLRPRVPAGNDELSSGTEGECPSDMESSGAEADCDSDYTETSSESEGEQEEDEQDRDQSDDMVQNPAQGQLGLASKPVVYAVRRRAKSVPPAIERQIQVKAPNSPNHHEIRGELGGNDEEVPRHLRPRVPAGDDELSIESCCVNECDTDFESSGAEADCDSVYTSESEGEEEENGQDHEQSDDSAQNRARIEMINEPTIYTVRRRTNSAPPAIGRQIQFVRVESEEQEQGSEESNGATGECGPSNKLE